MTSYDIRKSKEFGNLLVLAVKNGFDVDDFLQTWSHSTAEQNLCIPHNNMDGNGAGRILEEAINWHGIDKVRKNDSPCRFRDDQLFFIGFSLRYGSIYLSRSIAELLDLIAIDDLLGYDGEMTSKMWDEIIAVH